MKKHKKIVSIMAVSLVCFSMLAGCSNTDPPANDSTITPNENNSSNPSISSEPQYNPIDVDFPDYPYGEYGSLTFEKREANLLIAFANILFVPQFKELNSGFAGYFPETQIIRISAEVDGQFGQTIGFSYNRLTGEIIVENEGDPEKTPIIISDEEMKEISETFYELIEKCENEL